MGDVPYPEIRIGGRLEVAGLVHGWPTVVVPCVSPGGEWAQSANPLVTTHKLEFADTVDTDDAAAFTVEHATEVVRIGSELRSDDRVIVHCGAGINRSPSVAAGLLTAFGLDPATAWATVWAERPQAIGNSHVIAELDIALGAQRQFWTTWADANHRRGYWPVAPDAKKPLTDTQLRALVATHTDYRSAHK